MFTIIQPRDETGISTTVMSSVCILRPVFAFCVLRYVRRQNARRSPKCLEMLGAMLGAGRENAIGRGRKHTARFFLGFNGK